jgi:hypothetical protein
MWPKHTRSDQATTPAIALNSIRLIFILDPFGSRVFDVDILCTKIGFSFAMPGRDRWYKNNRPPSVVRTPDRLGDYLAALRNDFVLKHPVCGRGLNLGVELNAYEKETRVLLKLASTGRVVNILLRFGGVLEGYMKVMGIEETEEVLAWKDQLKSERQERVELFNKIMADEQRLVEAMGDETQQMELMTLLKHDVANHSEILTSEELDVMSDAYDRVVEHSGVVLAGNPPSWFLPPNDVLCEHGIYYLDAVRVSKCLTDEVLSTVRDHESWEGQEEACLRQAAVWADLNHPHVAKMLGACHIGKEPFVVHEPAEPLVSNRASAQSWEPVLGWVLGLQYLHERELGYKNFDDSRLLARLHVTASGVLTGLGLVPVKRNTAASLRRGVSNTLSTTDVERSRLQPENEDSSPSWSVPNDVVAFGLAICNTRKWVSAYSDEDKVLVLPPACPPFLDEQEWDLVQWMCARSPTHRASMRYVVHQLQTFVQRLADDAVDGGMERSPQHIDDFVVPKMNVRVAKAMESLGRTCAEWDEAGAMLKTVFNRLSSLYSQLRSHDSITDATRVMDAFVNVVVRFYTELTRRDIGSNPSKSSEVATFCASRAAAQDVAVFHHEIDRLLVLTELRDTSASRQAPSSRGMLDDILEDSTDSLDADLGTSDVQDWRSGWTKSRREQLRAFQSCLKNTAELKQQLRDPKARLEARMLLQFELLKRRSSYPNSVRNAMTQALEELETLGDGAEAEADAVPSWFIPPYEVIVQDKPFASGGFGDVYHGKWFDTDVVVKVLKPQPAASATSHQARPQARAAAKAKSSPLLSEKEMMEWFRSEADHWFMLNHQHVVHLYGACHVGTPFFVCEPAKATSLATHVKELARAKSRCNAEETGGDRSDLMRCLFLAGLGLKYLHERGILHCDLKGDNLMVGTDSKTIKLGDFGMSVLKRSRDGRHAAHEDVGAMRWKAPEYLTGEEPTAMSDVYGFGMCILELLSGKVPWSSLAVDLFVKFHVTTRKALPPRPKRLTDLQWSLIQHTCCFDPSERISLDAVVDMLHTFRFEE